MNMPQATKREMTLLEKALEIKHGGRGPRSYDTARVSAELDLALAYVDHKLTGTQAAAPLKIKATAVGYWAGFAMMRAYRAGLLVRAKGSKP